MIVVGLTGSIAMGKTEAARAFAASGIPVFDSDAEVHRLYSEDASCIEKIGFLFPEAIVDGTVDRPSLSRIVLGNPAAIQRLEGIVHPIVDYAQTDFLARCRRRKESIAVLDVPLLFETGKDKSVDRIVVVSAKPEIQRARAMARPGMTKAKFEEILMRQTPDSEKTRRADFVIDTSGSLGHTRAQVAEIISRLRTELEIQQ